MNSLGYHHQKTDYTALTHLFSISLNALEQQFGTGNIDDGYENIMALIDEYCSPVPHTT